MSETLTLAIDGGAITTPSYESHRRGKNWIARLTGPNAAKMEREFLDMRRRIVDLGDVQRGDAIEVGLDYYNARGAKRPDRDYYVVLSRSETELALEEHATAAQVIKAARVLREADSSEIDPGGLQVSVTLTRDEVIDLARLVETAGGPASVLTALSAALGA
ncbi:hypothetical protein [Methylorubrum extorquens]|jgi:hypothetical protein|uniref:Uncharacterized protein n=1 Tax=Methylorubrum extorquens DSM 13060 TaxID=882800 RepID=H1KV23_METEX|nr:hypothetical protein [Methylorubrum extorquens]EHP77558.1 hypothetical protein MetexDRAFT_6486 [Methylorubrum extorquens DSM 13060]